MTDDPRAVLAREPMGWLQIAAIGLCILLTALDGFDILAISFASPGIAREWGIDRAELGIVLSMELIGMGIGSVVIGTLADRVGRRPTILGCLVLMTVGMLLASTAADVLMLSAYRLATGLGIGGMLASVTAMAAEFSNDKSRNLCVTLMAAGYPVGAALGGTVVASVLAGGDWRSVFLFGAIATGIMIPLVLLFLPESVSFLIRSKSSAALRRLNGTLKRMGHSAVASLSSPSPEMARTSLIQLFTPTLFMITILLALLYSAHILTFYFILKWVPKIVVDMGFAASAAGGVLVWTNVGGACGAILFSLLTQRFDVKPLLMGALILSFVMVSLFGQVDADLGRLSWIAGGGGFFANAAVVGIYALIAKSFPAEVRGGGTGFVIGVGRAGAALSPILAGFMFAGGLTLPYVSALMAAGSLLAAFVLYYLRSSESRAA